MVFFKKIKGFWRFFVIYSIILAVVLIVFIAYVNSLLIKFEASQPERIVENQIEILQDAAKNGTLEKVLPITSVVEHIDSDKYPESFVKCIADGELTYEQSIGSFGAGLTEYNIFSDGKRVATVVLESANERTEMIVFTCADWSLKNLSPAIFEKNFTVPVSIDVSVNGEIYEPTRIENGIKEYSLSLLGDADVVLTDMFGNSEKQFNTVRKSFYGVPFTVPSMFSVECDFEIPEDAISSNNIAEYEYVRKYTDMPSILTYDIKAIPTDDNKYPDILISDNLGKKIDYAFGDSLKITSMVTLPEVPENLLEEANVLDFARKWSLFMTNDLVGGLSSISTYLLKDSYIYNVAYKWATGIDRTFTSVHTLYNPPFTDENIYNYVKYSDVCFSCDVYLVKKMRIANGLNVDDELSRKLFFVKYDATNNGINDPKWYVADMLGADSASE